MEALTEHLEFVKTVVDSHTSFWNDRKVAMENYSAVYKTKFYEHNRRLHGDTMIQIETSDAYGYIESIIGSLFLRAPAIQVSPDPTEIGQNVQAVEELINRFLDRKQENVQDASRLALIYPCSFMKLAPRESDDPLERVDIRACPPWDVIVDLDADCWERQRYCGHIYYMNLHEANKRFKTRKFQGVEKVDYFTPKQLRATPSGTMLDSMKYVQIVEFYNLVNDTLYFYSPNYDNGNSFIDHTPIPIRDFDDTPLPGIVPLYYSRMPERPLEGYSAISRIYDQLIEKNFLRTAMANAVRRDGRQFLYNKDRVDEVSLTGLSTGQDGLLIGIEGELAGVIQPISVPQVNGNHDRYSAEIENDLSKGSIMAPFTRGEATKATATEVQLLQQYSSSEIGRQARARDAAIERIANIYVRLLAAALGEEDVITVVTDGQVKLLKIEELEGKFVFRALDQANSPVAESMKQTQLTALAPLLISLGADANRVREEIVRAYRLPRELAIPAQVEVTKQAPRSTEATLEALTGRTLG